MKTHFIPILFISIVLHQNRNHFIPVPLHQFEHHQTIKIKMEAFQILDAQCNTCHRLKNPKLVFTEATMDSLAPKIYEQVFIKNRMPKGNKNKLSDEAKITLSQWIETLGHL